MNSYVIVIEVDNTDAVTKYTEGLRSLDAIWGRVTREAERLDALELAEFEASETDFKRQFKDDHARLIAKMYGTHRRFFIQKHHMLGLLGERSDLEHKLSLAKTAISPFRMTEGDVHLMNRWGSGERVSQLIKQYALNG